MTVTLVRQGASTRSHSALSRRPVFTAAAFFVFLLVADSGAPLLAAPSTTGRSQTMIDLVAKVIPTVVNITAHHVAPARENKGAATAAFTRVREGVGSGFVVDPSGCIVTNRHVVDGAYEIVVTFSDGHSQNARLIWQSTTVDVAFLKVSVDAPIPSTTLAANQRVQIGERVFAVGNPLGLGTSVSSGIVSAMNRNIKESPYDDFIQTDAAINHGSSGGPLFNEEGEVVGINTALYTSVNNGGSQGLGFAIPGRDIAFMIDQLKRYGRIRAGWLGVNAQKLTPDMAEAVGFPGVFGAIVAAVTPRSPAAAAGLRSGDIVQTIDGQPIYDITTLNRAAAMSVDKMVHLAVWRDGRSFIASTVITEASESHGTALQAAVAAAPRFASIGDMGLTLSPLEHDLQVRFALQNGQTGLVVTDVAGGGVADEAGFRPGDVIVSAQMTPVTTVDSFDHLLADQARGGRHRIIVLVQSAGGERWVALPLRL